MRGIAKSFRATGAGGGERTGTIAAGQALREVRPTHVFMQETRIETVAGANWIDRIDCQRGADDAFVASLCESAIAAELYDHQRYQLRELAHRRFQIVRAPRFASFAFVEQKHIDIAQDPL